jgi:hypothetical protein
MLACYISIIEFGKTSQKHLTHYNQRGDLSVNRSHIGYSIQGYICRSCFNPHQFGVATLVEIVVHGVRAMLDLHLEWVVL